ncbi:MAG: UvrD-helicase domain-containing protein [Anaerolineales bacterium]|nr:UvrD-helicase domain-containing protein [Anaerolineales bacterium]
MKFIADIHIHSHYSRATSKNLDFEHLTQWAQLKGVNLLATGDVAHPGWLQEMKDKLEPAEDGLFRLKPAYAQAISDDVPAACRAEVRFILGGEISSIYKKHDRVRKVHNLIFAPSLAAVEKIQAALEKIGNIRSDGRPILGLPSRDLLETILAVDPACCLIPAHIWTPWFSLLGSKSGYDSVEACFEDLSDHIFALETGLSSDPPMNWRVSALDRYTLVSNSDAHSPPKLAREATLLDTEASYQAIFDALKSGDPAVFGGTLEFFPEEGKYHHDGHRKCSINWDPQETIAHDGRCAVCGKPVTVGVLHRVEALADRPDGATPLRPQPFASLIPLPEVLGEIHGVGPNSKTVQQAFELLLAKLGPELAILRDIPLAEIEVVGGTRLAEGIRRMRAGQVRPIAGFDGQPGVIKLFNPDEDDLADGQLNFFAAQPSPKENGSATPTPAPPTGPVQPAAATAADRKGETATGAATPDVSETSTTDSTPPEPSSRFLAGLNAEQQAAVLATASRLVIVAGPGTGKTRTLTYRIARLIDEQGAAPDAILAITFTNKAAEEMASRLKDLLGADTAGRVVIKTFHAFGAMLLREAGMHLDLPPNFAISSEQERQSLLKRHYPDVSSRDLNRQLEAISAAKGQLLTPDDVDEPLAGIYRTYQKALEENGLVDFDDLVLKPVQLLATYPELQAAYRRRFGWIAVDEFQDVNLAQYRLLHLLTGPETNVCLIGDPDQAIYGFRGATPQFFDQFNRDFPPVEVLHLSRNYRSTRLILNASEQVIEKSPAGERVKIWSDLVDKTRLTVYHAPTDKAEAEYAVHEIEKMVGGTSYFSLDSARVTDDDELAGLTFADFAVLYRLSAQSQPLIEAFQRSGIPYQTIGQTPLVEYKDVRTVLACLWWLYHPQNSFHLEQVASPRQARLILTDLAAIDAGTTTPVPILIDHVRQILADRSILVLDEKSSERLDQLRRRAVPFETRLGDFLESTVLQKETDIYDQRAGRVTLMTLHAAKGLEFPVVFIVGCEEGLLPYSRNDELPDIDEERRLFYVGMTRAQQRLILTHAKSRFLFGQEMTNLPSRFVDDIEQALKELKQSAYRKPAKESPDHVQLKLF